MDIQAEKLELIEWLAKLKDINVLKEIKSIKKEADKNLFTRYTTQDLVNRAEASMEDIEANRVTKLSDFKREVEQWKQSKGTK